MVFHAGTAFKGGQIVNNSGRVLGVTGLGQNVKEAIDKAYSGVAMIQWKDVHYRHDIGARALNR
jgi:phosphoribosylamine--glycine ligase